MQGIQTTIQDTDLYIFCILTINYSIRSDPSVHDTQHESGSRGKVSGRLHTIVGGLLQMQGKTALLSTQAVSDNQWAYRLERNRWERERLP